MIFELPISKNARFANLKALMRRVDKLRKEHKLRENEDEQA